MWERARVRAPAIMVEVLWATEAEEVEARRLVRLVTSSSSISRNGRYLLSEGPMPCCFDPFSFGRLKGVEGPSTSPFASRLTSCVEWDPPGRRCTGDVG